MASPILCRACKQVHDPLLGKCPDAGAILANLREQAKRMGYTLVKAKDKDAHAASMRQWRADDKEARKLGLTVAQWRARKGTL